ncbi:hypothetical protein F9B16_40155 [Actinomadura montaniterrae]|uniref:Uncharacterized protein n=1 Tax=Actinomadura montaniterrae TaxID=1803903 RepID=A0A6L3VKH0_9ACTN|nr:hypothetical protein F9B16_40155 [Actinomadura montaniterrae]
MASTPRSRSCSSFTSAASSAIVRLPGRDRLLGTTAPGSDHFPGGRSRTPVSAPPAPGSRTRGRRRPARRRPARRSRRSPRRSRPPGRARSGR